MGYADEVLADSPLVYWRLGESVISSGAVDSSGNGRHGIYYGMTDGNLNKSGLVPTESDTACAFVDPGKVVLADAAWMDTSFTAGITVEGWFQPDTPGTGHQYLYSRYQGADNGRHLLLRITDVTGALRAAVYPNSTSGIGVDGPVVAALTAYHIVVTYDNTTLAIYVNGALYDSVSGALGAFSSSLNLPIYLGARQYGTSPTTDAQEHFDGRMDDWAVYGHALSPTRIAAHYQAGTAVPLLSQGWGLRTPLTPPSLDITVPYSTNGYNGLYAYCRANGITLNTSQRSTFNASTTADKGVDGGASATPVHTLSESGSWWTCGPVNYRIKPTRVQVLGRQDDSYALLRNWSLDASQDGLAWTTLASTTSGPSQGTWFGLDVSTNTEWKFLRVIQTGTNASGDHYLTLGEVEVYGTMTPDPA